MSWPATTLTSTSAMSGRGRFIQTLLSLVENFIVMKYFMPEPALGTQCPLLRAFLAFRCAGSLWHMALLCHKGRWLPCTERNYYREPSQDVSGLSILYTPPVTSDPGGLLEAGPGGMERKLQSFKNGKVFKIFPFSTSGPGEMFCQ